MDLLTLEDSLTKGVYKSMDCFTEDLMLIWSNCMAYNREDSKIYKTAAKLNKITQKLLLKNNISIDKIKKEENREKVIDSNHSTSPQSLSSSKKAKNSKKKKL